MLQKFLLIFSYGDYFRAFDAIEIHGNYISTPDHVEKNLRNTQMKFSESPDSTEIFSRGYPSRRFIARTDKTISSAQFLPFATPCQSSSCPVGRVDFSIMIGNILSHSRVRKGYVVYHNGVRERAACSTFDIHTPGAPPRTRSCVCVREYARSISRWN